MSTNNELSRVVKIKTYSGSNAGSKIRPLLDNAKDSVWIVSPWLGKEYAELLARLSQKGIEVRIITSKVDYNINSLEILKAFENPNLTYLILDKENDKSVFIHAKIYLIDKKYAISGSANLTYSGFNTNVETLSISENDQEAQQIERDFMNLWLKYESKSMSKEQLSKGTTYSVSRALPLATNIEEKQNCRLVFFPYYFFEYILRGSIRNPPMMIQDNGFLVIDGVTRQITNDNLLVYEINNKPPTDYVLNTENKYTLEIIKPTITSYKEATELALDYIIRKNSKEYYQTYGSRSYSRLYVPRKYDISFLKNYTVNVPIWSYDTLLSDGLKHFRVTFGSSGSLWNDMIYCPDCKTRKGISETIPCSVCGKITCRSCCQETGLIFKKKFCPSCFQNRANRA